MATKPRSTSPASTAAQHLGDGPEGHELARGQVGLGQQRLLGERPERAEEADAEGVGAIGGHGLAG